MDKIFDEFFNLLLFVEGEESKHKNDRGGHTKYGITQYLYNRIQDKQKLPRQSVSELTIEAAKEIYKKEFFAVVTPLQDKERYYNYFDMCVNSGQGNYSKLVAANPPNVYQWRRDFFDRIVENDLTQKCNLKGWYNRLAKIKNYFNKENS